MTLQQSSITTIRTEAIPEAKFKWGPTEGGYTYVKRDGQEFAVLRSSPHPEEYTLHPGEVWISCKTETIVDGTRWTDVIPRLAVPVRPGSWTEIEKRQKARELRQARPLRVWSALGDVLGRRGAEATPVVIGRLPDAHGDTAAPVVGRASMHEVKRTMVTLTPSGYVKYFESRGVELSLYKRDGRLKAQSRVQLSESDDALLHRVEPLIVGHLSGKPVQCSECSEPAPQPIKPRAWACREHAPE